MAKIPGNVRDLDAANFLIDDDSEIARRTYDKNTHDLLGSIAGAIGATNGEDVFTYNEINSLAASTTTTLVSYTAAVSGTTYIKNITVSGENIAEYELQLNGSTIDKKRTYFGGNLNTNFDLSDQNGNGVKIQPGDIIRIQVTHERPNVANFNGTIQSYEVP